MSARHFEIIKRPELIVPEAALRRRHINYSGSPPLILTYLGSDKNFDGSPLSFSFGAANTHRYLIAAVGVSSSSAISVGIGGVSATALVTESENFSNCRGGLYIAAVPSGTSGNVTTSSTSNFAVALYSAVNLNSAAAFDTDSVTSQTTAQPFNMSVGVQAKGFIIAANFCSPSNATTWTGLTTVDTNFSFSQLSFSGRFSAGNYAATTATTRALRASSAGGAIAFAASFR